MLTARHLRVLDGIDAKQPPNLISAQETAEQLSFDQKARHEGNGECRVEAARY